MDFRQPFVFTAWQHLWLFITVYVVVVVVVVNSLFMVAPIVLSDFLFALFLMYCFMSFLVLKPFPW